MSKRERRTFTTEFKQQMVDLYNLGKLFALEITDTIASSTNN